MLSDPHQTGHNAYRHSISAKFDNQPGHPRHLGVMAPECVISFSNDFVHSLIQTITKLGHDYVYGDYISAKF